MNFINKLYQKLTRAPFEVESEDSQFDYTPWFDCHMHTWMCGHAIGAPKTYVDRAAERGLSRICFTCHMPFDDLTFGGRRMRMREAELSAYIELVAEMREYGAALGVDVLCGIEGEVFPNPAIQDAIGEILTLHPFDFVLGSVHHHMPAYHDWFLNGGFETDDELITAYFETLRDAAATGLFHSMSHPDVIRLYGTIRGEFDPLRHESIIREAISAAVEADVCWEVNTSGRAKGPMIEHPDPIIRSWGQELGLKLTIGSDAHSPQSVGRFFDKVIPTLAEEGFDALHYFVGGERKAVDLSALKGGQD
jgi:histidinol-phosphatase (PHP family)|tara:strand:- start:1571 stop:2491 length:921 start_codon:yes stop_codon:yes gene_type:complete